MHEYVRRVIDLLPIFKYSRKEASCVLNYHIHIHIGNRVSFSDLFLELLLRRIYTYTYTHTVVCTYMQIENEMACLSSVRFSSRCL